MAKKNTTIFFCNECGYESSKWLGKCPACGKWNTFVEEKVVGNGASKDKNKPKSEVVKLKEVEQKTTTRIQTCVQELDRVLGGRFCERFIDAFGW